jgi:hydroxymethylpyrimidine/phosphomethylpyrimidine kinase
MGPKAVLVKGGHLKGDAIDILFHKGQRLEFSAPRIETRHTHGTGCTYSAAITAALALGNDLPTAIGRAKRYISEAIGSNPGLGAGSGPLNHHATVPRE